MNDTPEGSDPRRRAEDVYDKIVEVERRVEARFVAWAEAVEERVAKSVAAKVADAIDERAQDPDQMMQLPMPDGSTVGDWWDTTKGLKAGQEEILRKTDEMAEVVLGVPHEDYDGQVIRTGGLRDLADQSSNGGVRVHVPRWLVVALISNLLLFIATIAASWIASGA